MGVSIKKEIDNYKAETIVDYINKYFKVDCTIKSRERKYCLPRQIAQYFIYYNTKLTNNENGKLFNKDHACVYNSVKAIKNFYEYDPSFKKMFDKLETKLLLKIKYNSKIEAKKESLKNNIENYLNNQNLVYLYKLNNKLKNTHTKLTA